MRLRATARRSVTCLLHASEKSIDSSKRSTISNERLPNWVPFHPGSITEQYNICGPPGCRCKHGPYHNLSYTFGGSSKTLFIRQPCVSEMRRRTKRYVRLKKPFNNLVEANVQLAKEEVLQRKRERGKCAHWRTRAGPCRAVTATGSSGSSSTATMRSLSFAI